MQPGFRLVEPIKWSPVHGAALRADSDGCMILSDSATLDWYLLRWVDPRLDGVRVRLTIVARPADACDTNLYVHHWGGIDVCSIARDGTVAINQGADDLHVEHRPDGFLVVTVAFENRHPTLSLGTGKPHGKYQGTGQDQYLFESIEVELLPRHPIRQMIIDRVWQGNDPFHGLPGNLFEFDLQGWNSQHSYLSEAVAQLKPAVIVEIGVWKGGSTVFMANEAKKRMAPSLVIAVDTWLGSSEHWMGRSHADLSLLNGRPALYYKFLSNVLRAGVADYVLPLPIDSLNAAQILGSLNVRPDMIHLDGGHEYESVMADLRVWWPLLAPGGIFIGDDYYTDGMWAAVRKAYDDFFAALRLTPIENIEGKCRVRKPG